MTVTKRGSVWTGDDSADVDEYVRAFAAGGYPVGEVVHPACASCGQSEAGFSLVLDDDEGVAVR